MRDYLTERDDLHRQEMERASAMLLAAMHREAVNLARVAAIG